MCSIATSSNIDGNDLLINQANYNMPVWYNTQADVVLQAGSNAMVPFK